MGNSHSSRSAPIDDQGNIANALQAIRADGKATQARLEALKAQMEATEADRKDTQASLEALKAQMEAMEADRKAAQVQMEADRKAAQAQMEADGRAIQARIEALLMEANRIPANSLPASLMPYDGRGTICFPVCALRICLSALRMLLSTVPPVSVPLRALQRYCASSNHHPHHVFPASSASVIAPDTKSGRQGRDSSRTGAGLVPTGLAAGAAGAAVRGPYPKSATLRIVRLDDDGKDAYISFPNTLAELLEELDKHNIPHPRKLYYLPTDAETIGKLTDEGSYSAFLHLKRSVVMVKHKRGVARSDASAADDSMASSVVSAALSELRKHREPSPSRSEASSRASSRGTSVAEEKTPAASSEGTKTLREPILFPDKDMSGFVLELAQPGPGTGRAERAGSAAPATVLGDQSALLAASASSSAAAAGAAGAAAEEYIVVVPSDGPLCTRDYSQLFRLWPNSEKKLPLNALDNLMFDGEYFYPVQGDGR